MKYHEMTDRIFLYFSHWSRKGYSVFVSLGHEVKIARLPLHMYAVVQLKSSAKEVIVSMDYVSEVIGAVMEKRLQVVFSGKTEGEVYPDRNRMSVNYGGYIA